MPNEVPVVFRNGSDYDYYVIIKELNVFSKIQKSIKFFPLKKKKKL